MVQEKQSRSRPRVAATLIVFYLRIMIEERNRTTIVDFLFCIETTNNSEEEEFVHCNNLSKKSSEDIRQVRLSLDDENGEI